MRWMLALAVLVCPAITAAEASGQLGAVGDLYVTSYNSNQVLQYDPATGAFVGVFASTGLVAPKVLEFGPNGNLFVASQHTDSVIEFDGTTGARVRTFATGVSGPHALRFMPGGNLLVASPYPGTITEHDRNSGAVVRVFASGMFRWVQGLRFRANGNLLDTDQIGSRILEYDGNGGFLGTLASSSSGLNWPVHFDLGPTGNLFVANWRTNSVLELDGTTGAQVRTFASVNQPGGTTFGPSGHVYVSSVTHGVLVFDLAGNLIRTITGGGLNVPSGSTFKPPSGPPAPVTPYGCGVNPADSFTVVSGAPKLGSAIVFGVDDPMGVSGTGLAYLGLSLAPAGFPCGFSVPGFGLTPGAPGEVQIDVSRQALLSPFSVGPAAWTTPGMPAQIGLPIPNAPILVDLSIYAQGVLFDPVAPRLGLTGAIRVVISR